MSKKDEGGLPEKVWQYMKEHNMTTPGDRLVLGVSGGGDSMALLGMLLSLSRKGDFSLAVVHVNHGLRGEEAKKDQCLVENFCKKEGIFCRSFSYDIRKLAAQKGIGEEEAGRLARREALEQVMEEWGGTKIVLAHHQDDQAETVLHHLARGTGLRGLRGIKPVNGRVIRPFLGIDQEEIVHYLEETHLPYRTDASNLTDAYTRNRIRHHVLPYLKEQVNEKASSHIGMLAALAGEADDYLRERGREQLLRYGRYQGEELFLADGFFEKAHILVLYGLLEAAEKLTGSRKDLTRGQLEQVIRLFSCQVGKTLPFCRGFYALREYEGIRLAKEQPPSFGKKEDEQGWPLLIPGVTKIPNGVVSCRIFPNTGEDIVENQYTKWFDYDRMNTNLFLRHRCPGDYLIVTARGGRKKLKDFMINEKIPREERNELWLLADGSHILWVIGHRLGEQYKITKETRMILEITYQGGKENE